MSPSTGLNWCDYNSIDPRCTGQISDVRYGDPDPTRSQFFGDHTHPTAAGAKKVADRIVDFLTNTQNPTYVWFFPWILR
ncbi:MAG: SGNH/GDSL hydrolase family protein [Acidobacteriia bacterium]|nr:SGNH/GDSL hydrolase family protein [Terriglobia bacterium]